MDDVERAAKAAAMGLRRRASDDDARALRELIATDASARVRVAALGALVRAARRAVARDAWLIAAVDNDVIVRRRAAELAPALGRNVPERAVLRLLADAESTVAEAAAFALGERPSLSQRGFDALIVAASEHDDPLVRESAVAALGARGDERGRAAILRACHDRPPIRRRAVLALASFEGEDVDAALRAALEDKDWQVRQAAEDLVND